MQVSVHTVVSSLWHGPGSTYGFAWIENPTDKSGQLFKTLAEPAVSILGIEILIKCNLTTISILYHQLHLSNWVLGAKPKQQKQRNRSRKTLCKIALLCVGPQLPQAMVMRLHAYLAGFVIFTPKAEDSVSVWAFAHPRTFWVKRQNRLIVLGELNKTQMSTRCRIHLMASPILGS